MAPGSGLRDLIVFLALPLMLDLVGTGCLVVGIVGGGQYGPALIGVGIALLISGSMLLIVASRAGGVRGSRRLLSEGIALPATVMAMKEPGATVNDSPVFGFQLDIRREGHPPLQTTVRQQVPRMFVGAVLPGSTVMVRRTRPTPAGLPSTGATRRRNIDRRSPLTPWRMPSVQFPRNAGSARATSCRGVDVVSPRSFRPAP